MSSIYISSGALTTGGLVPHNWARNGVGPSGGQTRELADYINFLLGYRLRHIATNSFVNTDSPDFAASQNNTTFRIRTHVSPNGTAVRIRTMCIPTDVPGGVNYTTPKGWWVITNKDTSTVLYDDGTSGTDRSFIFDARVTTVNTVVPDDYHLVDRIYTGLTGGADYTFEFHQSDGLRSIGYSIHEVYQPYLDTATATVIDSPKFGEGFAIYNRDILDLLTDLDTAWNRLGPNYFALTVPGTTAYSMTGTTETNLIDGITTTNGWTTTTDGFYIYPQYHDSEDTRVAATYTVPAVGYVYASATGGGTGSIRFRYGTGANDYFSKIDGISAAGWYTTTTNLNGNSSEAKVDMTAVATTAGTTVNLFAAGIYARGS